MCSRIGLLLGLVIGLSSVAAAAPGQRAGSAKWRLDLTFHDPQRMTLRLPGTERPATYWYVLYEVANHTGMDRQFFPSFRLVTDTLQVVEGGDEISPTVYDAIAERHHKQFPYLARPAKVTGILLQGEANKRASVAVFRDFDQKADSFSVFGSGFAGEIERKTNPAFDPAKPESEQNPRHFILRRTLEIRYDLPGDPDTRVRAKPVRKTRRWVMR